MEVDWVSAAQNENGTDRNWIVDSVRPTLDARGFRTVKIQAPDCDKGFWQVFDEFEKDPAYREAVEAVGYHYINGREPWDIDQVSHRDTTPKARASGKQLWASEEWSMSGGTLGRHRRDVPGPADQQALYSRPHLQDRDLVPDRFDLRRPALVRHGGHAGRHALVRALHGLAGDLGRGAHHAVRPARLEVSRRRLRADRSEDLERHLRHA